MFSFLKNNSESRQWVDFIKNKINEVHYESVSVAENYRICVLIGIEEYTGFFYEVTKYSINRGIWREKDYTDKSTSTIRNIPCEKLISISKKQFNEIQNCARNKLMNVHLENNNREIMNELEQEL